MKVKFFDEDNNLDEIEDVPNHLACVYALATGDADTFEEDDVELIDSEDGIAILEMPSDMVDTLREAGVVLVSVNGYG